MDTSPEIPGRSVTIRQFQPQDSERVWQVSIAAITPLGISTKRGPQHKDFDDIKGTYIDKGGDFLVAEVDGRIVAMGGYLRIDENTANIRRMRTLPEFQGQGIGRMILTRLEESIKHHGFRKIRLGTSTIMPNAIKLYSSMGFQETERHLNPNAGFGPDFAEIIFEKEVI